MIRSISIVPLLGVFLLMLGAGPVRADEKAREEKIVIIIGRSSLRPPLAQHLEALIESHNAKYLQELAWKVYQRELKHTKPAK